MRYILVALSVVLVLTPTYGTPQLPSYLQNLYNEINNMVITTMEDGIGGFIGSIDYAMKGASEAAQKALKALENGIQNFVDGTGKIVNVVANMESQLGQYVVTLEDSAGNAVEFVISTFGRLISVDGELVNGTITIPYKVLTAVKDFLKSLDDAKAQQCVKMVQECAKDAFEERDAAIRAMLEAVEDLRW
ncbi:uncharacterized protein LOC129788662 [Lutzomyia longipalpis]|uniref:uncharacterized protein LOC129788662 n=1 Tax=Lutzomyia longipalpis TaxID=7200 RepID=UPI00248445E7|nr:uncharacterized protein LOC129788662 [Lutzomyia longipalpis]